MALDQTPITGRVPMADDADFASGVLSFELSGPDTQDDAAIPPAVVSVDLDGADIPAGFTIWPNASGVAGTTYKVTLRAMVNLAEGVPFNKPFVLGSIQVGDAASYTIGELLSNPVPVGDSWNLNIQTPATARAALEISDFASRADLVTWAASNTPAVYHVRRAGGLQWVYMGAGTYISDMPGWYPCGDTTPNHFKTNTTPMTTDMGAAIIAALAYEYAVHPKRGTVHLLDEMYATSVTIEVPQRCGIKGRGGAFRNVYISTHSVPLGSGIFALAGMNDDIVVARGSVAYDAGVMEETGTGDRNSDQRFFQRFESFVIYGNRSSTATPDTRDTNTAGRGLVIEGCRKVLVDDVTIMYCADTGFWAGSYNYGAGNLTSTNLTISRVASLSNYGKGFEIYSGDHTYQDIIAGYNGDTGIYATGTGHYTNCASWNNLGYGVLFGGATYNGKAIFTATRCYDNDFDGFLVTTGNAPAIVGLTSTGNGRGADADKKANLVIGEAAQNWMFTGVYSDGMDYTATVTTTVGIKVNSTHFGVIGDWLDVNSPVAMTPSPELTVTTITGGVLDCGRFNQVALDVTGGATITSIICAAPDRRETIRIRNVNADPVVFEHDLDVIRTNTGADVTLQNRQGIFVCDVVTDTTVQQQ